MSKQLPQLLHAQPEQHLILQAIQWQDYLAMDTAMEAIPGLRLTYLEGLLEIMTLSPEHERTKTIIGRLLETYALVKNIDLHGCGSTTYRDQTAARGLEPDECYCVGQLKDRPDLAVEVIITSGGLNKLAVYQGLKVPEIWLWETGKLQIFQLHNSDYIPTIRSQFFPDLDPVFLSQYVRPDQQPAAIREFYKAITE